MKKADIELTSSSDMTKPSLQFLADMAHDLRAPLNGIINFAYLLRMGSEGALTPTQAETVARIEKSGHQLLEMLNDLLDLSRLDMDRLGLDLGPTAVSDLILAACEVEGTPLSWQREGKLPLVQVDEARTRQALAMLTAYLVETRAATHLTVQTEARSDIVEIRLTGHEVKETAVSAAHLLTTHTGQESRRLDFSRLQLVLSARLLQAEKGALGVSSVGQDLTFSVILPQMGAVL